MYPLLLTVIAVLGLLIGSFLNVVIYRVPRGESVVRPRSHCPQCGTVITAGQNVPVVSYLLLRGRCHTCGQPIPIRYPLVEAGTGLLFLFTAVWALRTGREAMLPALLYLAALGIALALIDIAVHRLPNVLVLPAYPIVAVLLAGASAVSGDWWALARAGIGAAVLFAFYLLLVLIYPAGMGLGDVKLAGVLGAVLGYIGFGALVVGAFAAFLMGALFAVGVMVARRGTMKSAVPFGPFMLLGCAVGVVAGGPIAGAYWTAVGA